MDPVYLDHAATTPVRDEVRAAMDPFLSRTFGNPSSVHRWGRAASAALEGAREELASAIGARTAEVRFVRGGTESDNLAIVGSVRALSASSDATPLVLASAVEHSAVLAAAEYMAGRDEADVHPLEVAPDGSIRLDDIDAVIDGRPAIASVMWVNNETGLILPVAGVVERLAPLGVRIHSDASQALGKVPVRVDTTRVDLLTGTGHKLGGPRGSGFLFVRDGVMLEPMHFGGGQERSLRPGTEDVAGAVGLARAVRLAVDELEVTARRLGALRDRLQARLTAAIPSARVNGGAGPRAPHVLSLGLPDIEDGAAFLMALDLEGLAASGGSACHSGAAAASHVIAALYGADDAMATVRLSMGHATTEADVDRAADVVETVWRRTAREAA